jgi:hypothetical protein
MYFHISNWFKECISGQKQIQGQGGNKSFYIKFANDQEN